MHCCCLPPCCFRPYYNKVDEEHSPQTDAPPSPQPYQRTDIERPKGVVKCQISQDGTLYVFTEEGMKTEPGCCKRRKAEFTIVGRKCVVISAQGEISCDTEYKWARQALIQKSLIKPEEVSPTRCVLI